MAKLSETFKVGGGESTAPVSNNQRKLSTTFRVKSTASVPKLETQETEAPAEITTANVNVPNFTGASHDQKIATLQPYVNQPKAVTYQDIIDEYESLPNTNIFARLWDPKSGKAYKRKQELNPLYEQAKDIQTKEKLDALGLTDYDIVEGMSGSSPYFALRELFKSKGMTDNAEIKELIKASQDMVKRTTSANTKKNMEQFADEHKVLGTLASFPLKVGADITGAVENTGKYLSGQPLTNSTGGNWGTQLVQGMRNEVSDEMSGVGKLAYDVGTSIGDMAPIIALGGAAGLVYAGASAAQNSIPELIDRGLTPNQIIFTAMANGLAEAALEKLPLGNLEKMAQQPIEKSFKSIAKVIGSQMANEGIEESGTDIANTIFDALINGNQAELNQDIKAKGFWPAMWDYVKQVGYSGLAGALSGGIMGGGTSALNVAMNGFYDPNAIPTLNQQTEQTQTEIPKVDEQIEVPNYMKFADGIDSINIDGKDYSIDKVNNNLIDADGNEIPIIDPSTFDTSKRGTKEQTKRQFAAILTDYIKDRFLNKRFTIRQTGHDIGFLDRSAKEFAGSDSSFRKNNSKMGLKANIAARLQTVIENAIYNHYERNTKSPDDPMKKRGLDKYDISIAYPTESGVDIYTAVMDIGLHQDGNEYFYDIVEIKPKKKAAPRLLSNDSVTNFGHPSFDSSINQENGSVKSDANDAQGEPDFASIYGWSNAANQIIPKDSYARSNEFRNQSRQHSDALNHYFALQNEIKALEDELKNESKRKPREEWTEDDEFHALLGDRPMTYTHRGEELRLQIDAKKESRNQYNSKASGIEKEINYRSAQERLEQLRKYEASDITPATREEYEGFSKECGESGLNQDVREGKAIVAEMSPEEYIRRCAYEIFGQKGYSTLETTLNTRTQKNVDKIIEAIRNGEKIDAPYLNYETRGQEGLHRALAAYELGIDKIPVVVKGTPLDNYTLGKEAREYIREIDDERRQKESERLDEELFGDMDADELLDIDTIEELERPTETQEISKVEKPKEKRAKVMYEDIGLNSRTTEDYGDYDDDGSVTLEMPMEGGVPTITDENGTTSQVATNSLRKFFESRYDKEGLDHLIANIEDGKYQKQVKSMQKTYENAIDEITKYGPESKFDDIVRTGIETDDDLAVAHNLLDYYNQKGDMERVDILMSKIQTSGTDIGRALHFFNIFGDSALGVQQATNKLAGSRAKQFINDAKKNPRGKKAKRLEEIRKASQDIVENVREVRERKKKSEKLARALRYNVEQKLKQQKQKQKSLSMPKTFDMILEEVNNTLEDEYASVNFTDEARQYFATMIAEGVKTEIMADEIDHYMKHGSFYPLENEVNVPKPTSRKLDSILAKMGSDMENVEQAPKTFDQIREEVKNSLEKEMASIDFTDDEISYLARMMEYGATNEELTNAIVQKLETGYMTMSAEDIELINSLYEQADNAPTSKEAAKLKEQAAAVGAKYLGEATFMDKLNAWRYLAMLGNTRTMARNLIGNWTFGAVTDIKDVVGALLEKAIIKNGGERTKAIINPANESDRALLRACNKDFDEVAYEEATKGGHKYNMQSAIESQRKIFNNKLVEGKRNLTTKVLEGSDIMALRIKYKKALAGYLKANGYNADVLKTDDPILKRAREYAINQAKEATFHADNALAELLSESSRRARERGGVWGKIQEVLIESLAPFKKTPANILQQGFEYSPAGIIKLLNQIRTKADVTACLDTLAKNLTGTGIMALGWWLASTGRLIGQRSDDDDPFNKGSNYALKIGKDHTYTLDWAAPAALPLFVGAEIYNALCKNGTVKDEKNVLEAMLSLTEPVIEMSMLQGLSNTLDALANTKGSKLSTTIANIGSGYLSQLVPTDLGQVARTIDPYRRNTRTNTSSYSNPVLATLEKAGTKAVNKIPFLSMANEKYTDVWGESQKNTHSAILGDNILGRAFQNFISPGYSNDISMSDREQKLAELEKTYTGKGSLIPSLADNNKPTGGRLTNKEYTKWNQTHGNEMKLSTDAALSYQGRIPEADLQDYIHDIENFANAVAKNKTFGTPIPATYKKAYEAYINGGRNYRAVMEYYIQKSK